MSDMTAFILHLHQFIILALIHLDEGVISFSTEVLDEWLANSKDDYKGEILKLLLQI
jgi:hypothetical protein